jgi:hypothetical protein
MPSDDSQWAWKLRLFASLDLAGSTAYKYRGRQSVRTLDAGPLAGTPADPSYVVAFDALYTQFPACVLEAYGQVLRRCPAGSVPFVTQADALRSWKLNGDEVVMATELRHYAHSLVHVLAICRAMALFRKRASDRCPLPLKATAWLAGFPVANREVHVEVRDGSLVDYIGRAMDTGFRLAKLATSDRMPVSVDLALMLSDTLQALGAREAPLYLDAREHLPGVNQGVPYPHVWWAVSHRRQWRAERSLRGGTSDLDALTAFCEQFLWDTYGLRRPFIDRDVDPRYKRVPVEWERQLRALRDEEWAFLRHSSALEASAPPTGPGDADQQSAELPEPDLPVRP